MGQPLILIEQISTQVRKFPAGWHMTVKVCLIDTRDGKKTWALLYENIALDFEHTLNNKQLAKRLLASVVQELA